MRDKLEEIFENCKIYLVIICGMMLVLDAIIIACQYQEEGSLFGYNKAMNCLIWILLISTGILVITTIVISVILRIWQGDLYLSVTDYLDTIMYLLFPVDAKNKKEIQQILNQLGNKDEIIHSSLWKKMSKGVNILNLLKTILAFVFGSMIVYTIVESWLEMDDNRILMTVLGSLFAIILYFWSFACGIGTKKRPDYVLDYCVNHNVPYSRLNNDFMNAQRYGLGIYKGDTFIFIETGKGMQVVNINEVIKCDVLRMSGWNPRRLFLSYYILDIETEEQQIMKYGISRNTFYKLKNVIEQNRKLQ